MNDRAPLTRIEYEDGKCVYLTEAQMTIIAGKAGEAFAGHVEAVVRRAFLKAMSRRLLGALISIVFWGALGWMLGRHPEIIAKIQEWGE
jgi:hypothetical protein